MSKTESPGPAPLLDLDGPEALLAGRPASAWAAELGLPFHLYDRSTLRRNVRAFLEVFRRLYPRGELRYAAKACTHPEVFRTVVAEGAGLDVASPHETRCALEAGVPPQRLDLNGNCKQDAEIERACDLDMLLIVDSAEELRLVDALAARRGRRPRALLRLAGFGLGPVTASAVFTSGTWTKFGLPLADLPALLDALPQHPHVQVLGFHTHIGTQITEPEPYLAVLQTMLEWREPLERAGGRLEMVNLGGGFPESSLSAGEWGELLDRIREGLRAAEAGDPSRTWLWEGSPGGFERGPDGKLDLGAWKGEKFHTPHPKEAMLEEVLRGSVRLGGRSMPVVEALHGAGSPTLVLEPGRALVGDAALSVARVAHVRTVAGGHNLVTLEMGVTDHGEALVSTPMRRWVLTGEPGRREAEPFHTFVGGNLCFSGDMLSRVKVPLQRRPRRGELVAVLGTGAYNAAFFASNANSFPRPARVLVDSDGSWVFLHRPDSYESLF